MRLKPTELGRVIAQMLEKSFNEIMNVSFTKEMEDDLERVASSEKDWKKVLRDFWKSFMPTFEIAEKEAFVPKVDTDLPCPKCGSHLQKIWSHSKYFFGCSKYPECDFSASQDDLNFNKADYQEDFDWNQPCPNCGSHMKVRHGKFGAFLGCTKYPECKGIVNIPKKGESVLPSAAMPSCPAIGCTGHMVARKSRFGKTFYSCSTFPDCDVIVNDIEHLTIKYDNYERKAYEKKLKKGKEVKKTVKEAVKKSAKKTKTSSKKTTTDEKLESQKKKRVMPQLKVSDDLSVIVNAKEMARAEVLKKVWEYIRLHNLQDPKNKKLILPDALLAKVFKTKEPVDMFQIPGLLSAHLEK
jgi:DNA topoisomerase-1